jgi:hypothetical protein
MDDLFPNLVRTVSSYLSNYGLVVLIPLLAVIVWVVFPRGLMRVAAAIVIAVAAVFLFFGDHPAISPVTSAISTALYHFRSMLR